MKTRKGQKRLKNTIKECYFDKMKDTTQQQLQQQQKTKHIEGYTSQKLRSIKNVIETLETLCAETRNWAHFLS